MGAQNGTITGVNLVSADVGGIAARKAYLVTADFPAYTGSTDTATITGIGAAIAAHTRNGKTNTLRAVVPNLPGIDTNAQAVYFTGTAVQAATISSDDATGQLSNAAGSELSSATASQGVGVIAIVDES